MLRTVTRRLAAVGRDQGGLSSIEYVLLLSAVTLGLLFAGEQLSGAVMDALNRGAGCLDGTVMPQSC